MKNFFSLLITLCSLAAFGQYPVSSISITLPPNPAANTGDWAMPFVITAQAKLLQGQVPGNLMESRMLVTIKSSVNKICGTYTQQTAPMSNFNTATKTWSGAAAVSLLGNACALQPGVYELCVQFFSSYAPVVPLSSEVCKSFTIADTKEQGFSHPRNIVPDDGKVFSTDEAKQPFIFRWTPVLPKPKADVQYKLRVVELKIGQTPAQAIRTNTVLFEKEVTNQTQLLSGNNGLVIWPIASDSKYAWYVQAYLNGKLIGESEATTFMPCCRDSCCPPINALPVNGQNFTQKETKQPIQLRWVEVVDIDDQRMYTVHVYAIEKGQTPAQAIKINKPVFEKTVKTKETTWQMPPEYANAKEAKTFVWNVRATDKAGKAVGGNNGTSEPTSFTVSSGGCIIDYSGTKMDSIICKGNGQYKVCATFFVNKSGFGASTSSYTAYPTKILQVQFYDQTTLTPIGPAYPININKNEGDSYMFCQTISIPTSTTGIKVKFDAQVQTPNPAFDNCVGTGNADTLVPSCLCKPCELNQVNVSNNSIAVFSAVDGSITVMNNVTAGPNNITKIVADLVAVTVTPINGDCNRCDKQKKNQGNFVNLNRIVTNSSLWTNTGNGTISPNSSGGITRNLTFKSVNAAGVNISGANVIRHTIGLPPTSCCGDNVEVWIRYTVWDNQCHVCDKVVKATLKRASVCTQGGGNPTDVNNQIKEN